MSNWIKWNGGECPVPAETLVCMRLRGGYESDANPGRVWQWRHDNDDGDIVAYKIVDEEQQPAIPASALNTHVGGGHYKDMAIQPVAWLDGPHGTLRQNPLYRVNAPQSVAWSVPLYTAPPARQALTDEQISAMRQAGYLDADDYPDAWAYERGVRDAERAHGIDAGKGGANG